MENTAREAQMPNDSEILRRLASRVAQLEGCITQALAAADRFHEIADRMERRAGGLPPRYLNMRDAANYCGLCLRTIEGAVAKGEITSFMRGRRLVLRESLESWVEGKVAAITHAPH
ncbi:helix-turn-helix domain-containing protein [Luteolibacter luteus]|uniref:Helix-turn-helix domain-containing protein n=1 Tax=Luteolibacter luteus TaxID=2728835 RepID=A0A858RPY6_9BACT|nr:helix-turn-helix domain-containing protein [Luteolibacter luteus]QJE97993.1 helix-turn-helix domain-containing protein [Luteolibacter luteus]